MSKNFLSALTDTGYLKSEQYRTAVNLNSRILLHERFGLNPYPWPRWVFDRLLATAGERILEVGCGSGYLWQHNLERIPAGWEVVLSDFSPGMVQQARDHLSSSQPGFRFIVSDIRWLPWPAETFDMVVANHMLYHVPDRPQALAEIHRVLKPGGRLYAATNGLGHMAEIFAMMRQLDPDIRSQPGVQFGLENGEEQLAAFFPQIDLHLYHNDLEITEVEPLLTYICSMRRSPQVEQNVEFLERALKQQLAEQGAIRVTRSTGLFEAQKGL